MFLSSLFANKNPGPTDNFWYEPVSGGSYPMTADAAMRISAVYACIDVISETVGMLPFILYKRLDDGGKKRAKEHRLFDILRLRPNEWQSAIQFRSILTGDAILRGCGYAELINGRRGFATQKKRLHPDTVTVEQLSNGRIRFKIRNPDGTHRYLTQDDVFVLPGKFSDGISKVNAPITLMAQTTAIASEQESHNKNQLQNGIRLSGVLQTDQVIKEEAGNKILSDWRRMFGGSKSAERVALLPLGLKFQQLSMTNEDAQFIEGQQFTNKQIARFFRVQPHKIGILDDATFSNIEQQAQEFVTDTMMPWFIRWEQAVSNQLLLEDERESYFAEFLVDALLRGDSTARSGYYNAMVHMGAMTRNEVRVKENMNPLKGLDKPLQPLNMTRVGDDAELAEDDQQEEDTEEEETAQSPGNTRIAEVFTKLFSDIAGRVVRAEVNAVSRILAKKNLDKEKLAEWAEDFYSKHEQFMVQAFESAGSAYATLAGVEVDIKGIAEDYNFARKDQLINGVWQANVEGNISLLTKLVMGRADG